MRLQKDQNSCHSEWRFRSGAIYGALGSSGVCQIGLAHLTCRPGIPCPMYKALRSLIQQVVKFMQLSLEATCTLTDWSKRTVWRRIGDKTLAQIKIGGRVLIPLTAITPHLCIPLTDEELAILACADGCEHSHSLYGDAESQNEMALIFLNHQKLKSAIYWLKRAADQGHADAMNLLGICYLRGEGVPRDDANGIMWLTKSASLGHLISREQMNFIHRMQLI